MNAKAGEVRHAMLKLHKAMIDAQRLPYERSHGRIETSNQLLGLVLNHPDFEWIRALSALIAQLDEWTEEAETAGDEQLEEILGALRGLIRRSGSNPAFTERYWAMIDVAPDVLMEHVKLTKLLGE